MISAEAEEIVEAPHIQKRPSALSGFWKQYKKSKLGLIGLSIMIFYVLVALFAPLIAPYDPSPQNVVGPSYNKPEIMSLLDNNPILNVNLGKDQNCSNLASWEARGYDSSFLVNNYDLTNLPTLVDEGNGMHSYDFSDYNNGRDSLTVRDIVDTNPNKTDGRAIEIAIDTTEDTYTSANSDKMVILRQHMDWTREAFNDPDDPGLSEIPKQVFLMVRYRIEYTGDLTNKTLYPGDDPRKHFNIKIRAMREDQDNQSLQFMTHPIAAEFDTYNPRETYSLDDKELSSLLIYNVFTTMSLEDGSVQELNRNIILQLEVEFENVHQFSGSIKVIVDEFYIDIESYYFGVLGTTGTGADVFSQLIYGTQVSLLVGVLATFFSVSIGIVVGLIAGYLGGKIDDLLMRFVDFLLIMPGLPLMLVLASVLKPSFWNIIIVISILGWTGTARIIRAQTLAEKEKAYVNAARAAGGSDAYIIFRHILPNVLPIVFAQMATGVSGSIQSEAAISFLGLGGIEMSWGKMLQASTQGAFTRGAWWIVIFPGLCICLLSLAFILVGHTVEHIVNPRLREL
ncbi:MAG: ABC transporter permease [Candidatus Hodarchaeales archaeon]